MDGVALEMPVSGPDSLQDFAVRGAVAPARVGDVEDSPDDELMALARDGDLHAFEEIVRRHQGAVIGMATRMLGCVSDGEDIAQAAFVRAWKSAPRYRPEAKVSTWLLTITRNLALNEIRRRKSAGHLPLDPPGNDQPHHQISDPAQRPADAEAAANELADAVEAAIAALPENARTAVVLRRYENLPYEEIAAILKTTVPAVKSLLFRARAELRASLAAFLGDAENS